MVKSFKRTKITILCEMSPKMGLNESLRNAGEKTFPHGNTPSGMQI